MPSSIPLGRIGTSFICAVLSSVCIAQDLPSCVTRWLKRADVYLSIKVRDEAAYKTALKKEMAKIYAGDELALWQDWAAGGSLKSDYYDSVLADLKDTSYGPVIAREDHQLETAFTQASCYRLSVQGPGIEQIVREYKITNMTQQQVNAWRARTADADDAEICVEVHGIEKLVLDEERERIVDVKRSLGFTKLQLKPE